MMTIVVNELRTGLLICLLFIIANATLLAQAGGSIKGVISDAQTGETLPGAHVMIEGTSFGTVTDPDGNYAFFNLQPGDYRVTASYISYEKKSITIKVLPGKGINGDVALDFSGMVLGAVEVTAQAKGQIAAINQQLSARSIKNVVSAARIQEIPDANAAEAVGRLPGVSLLRVGGEGQKVVIRGLSPKYSKVEIGGVSMASTDDNDRSANLSMISPYMLDGIEVTKAAMADKEADVMGGRVNFILKEAPEDLQFNLMAQTSYNGLKNQFGDYKFVVGGSNRFFDNRLGIFALVDIEKRNRSSFEATVGYDKNLHPEGDRNVPYDTIQAYIANVNMKDVSRSIHRYGGTLILDYKLPNGKISLSNFLSSIDKDVIVRSEVLAPGTGNTHSFRLSHIQNTMTVLTNSLRLENNFNGLELTGGISYSYSENRMPRLVDFSGLDKQAFENPEVVKYQHPGDISGLVKEDVSQALLTDVRFSNSFNEAYEVASDINLQYTFNLTEKVNVMVKTGAMIKEKGKGYNNEAERTPFAWDFRWNDIVVNEYFDNTYLGSADLPYELFIDPDYEPVQFPGGDYTISNQPDLDMANGVADLMHEMDTSYYDYVTSKRGDYDGTEKYRAAYLMSEMKIGKRITFIPGIRYEQNQTRYLGVRGNASTNNFYDAYEHFDTITTRTNGFWLPMVHLKYKPLDWLDFRLAYTRTLTRPDFNQIIPSWNITDLYISWNNPDLKPSMATNYDLYVSFYTNRLGLLSFGGFLKKIDDMIFRTEPTGSFDYTSTGLPEYTWGKPLERWINNDNQVDLWGIEAEWQTNFWYLPGALKGLVFNINYTHTFSEAKYPLTTKKTTTIPGFPPTVVTEYTDTVYTNRLFLQPNDIMNVTLGYDYKDFSVRLSMLYTNDIFRAASYYTAFQASSEASLRWDISLKQELPVDGLQVFANLNNITGAAERDQIKGRGGYPLSVQYYGLTVDMGLRYKF
ncbi:MAG: TonB-dependent receptor [Bacteroidota bacterium]